MPSSLGVKGGQHVAGRCYHSFFTHRPLTRYLNHSMEVPSVILKRDSGTMMDFNGSAAPSQKLPRFAEVFQVQDAILSRGLLTLVISLTANELAGDPGYSLEV